MKKIHLGTSRTFGHDLRSILASVRWSVGLIKTGMLGPVSSKQKKYLQIADDGIAKAVELIGRLNKVSVNKEKNAAKSKTK